MESFEKRRIFYYSMKNRLLRFFAVVWLSVKIILPLLPDYVWLRAGKYTSLAAGPVIFRNISQKTKTLPLPAQVRYRRTGAAQNRMYVF